jgi:hypothetical protein
MARRMTVTLMFGLCAPPACGGDGVHDANQPASLANDTVTASSEEVSYCIEAGLCRSPNTHATCRHGACCTGHRASCTVGAPCKHSTHWLSLLPLSVYAARR